MTASAFPLHIDDEQYRLQPRQKCSRHPRQSGVGDCKESELPEERLKTVIAALSLFASSLCTSFCLSFLNEVSPRDRPLPDIVFQLVPVQEWAWPFSDVLVVAMASLCGFSILLHRYRWIVMRRILLIASVLYFLRAMAMLVTWMPLSDRSILNKCITPQWLRAPVASQARNDGLLAIESASTPVTTVDIPWSVIGLRMWKYGISLGFVGVESNRVLCGDYIYSGHTLMYVLTTLTLRTYMPRTGFFGLLRYAYPLATIAGMLFVVISRLHYTIDVLVAYWMTTLTFWCYHLLVALPRPPNNCAERNRFRADFECSTGPTTILLMESDDEGEDGRDENDNEWRSESGSANANDQMFSLFGSRLLLRYFEKNVPAGFVVPREMQWPFGGPKWLCRFVSDLNDM